MYNLQMNTWKPPQIKKKKKKKIHKFLNLHIAYQHYNFSLQLEDLMFCKDCY
jgi:hypothetical protein